MKSPFRLVPDAISGDTIRALEELLADAKRAKDPLIGIAFVGMYRERKYIVNTAGETRRNPTFTIGMLFVLALQLALRILAHLDRSR